MSLIESRRNRPTDDPIFALNGEATARAQAGENILNATLGAAMDDDGKLSVFGSVLSALRELPPGKIAGYAPIAGVPGFLQAVKEDLLSTVPALIERSVAVATPGGSGALHQAIVNYLEPGQTVLTTNYYWSPYNILADESDRKLTTFNQFDAQGNFDVAALDAAVTRLLAEQGRVLLFLNDPCHNPTGYSMRPEEWRAVGECLTRHAKAGGVITVLLDVAYIEYAAGNTRAFLPEVAALSEHVQLLFAWSASKSFALYGARVGALVAVVDDPAKRAATQAALTYSCRGTWSNCNHSGMAAVTTLLTDPAAKVALTGERDALKSLLLSRVAAFNARAKGLRYPRYEGGFFVTVFDDDAKAQAARMRERGVFVVPGAGTLRVALCSVPEREIPRLCEALLTR